VFRIHDIGANSRLAVTFTAALTGIVILIVWAVVGHGSAAADAPNRAGLVVTFSDGYTVSQCIEFAEAEISGAELLERSGLPVVSVGGGMGAAVCKIGDEGCDDPNDCFCQCHGADCRYWAYYTLEDGQWKYSNAGASLRKVHHGDVDGWAWGSGKAGSGAIPQPYAFQGICPQLSQSTPSPSPQLMEADAPPVVESQVAEPTSTAASAGLVTSPQPSPDEPMSTPVLAQVLPARAAPEGAQPKTKEDESSGFPVQLIVFFGLAAAMAVAAVVLVRRRARG
jgi:hypothetical protein